MKHRYECLLAVDTRGQEDSVKEIIERLEADLAKEGATVEQVQKMDKRPLAYSPRHIDSAYYVNFIFEADPNLITKLRGKFKLDPIVFLQHYQRLPLRVPVRISKA
ncbi:MAG TPA: 30S ribosomal protein S6 [Chthoniobacterales bacterium]|jgi:small subunit ribosomal protein S6|nr:30S ribosomal protein S6 [Chthoniobacterales bacterium]